MNATVRSAGIKHNLAFEGEEMKFRELSESQYIQSMGSNMTDVTKSAEPLINIWYYAEQLLKNNLLSEYGFKKQLIEAVYENDEKTYQHILLFTNSKNCYMVIVVDMINRSVYGHYYLNLNEKYGG